MMQLLIFVILLTAVCAIPRGRSNDVRISKDAILRNLQSIISNNEDDFHFDMVNEDLHDPEASNDEKYQDDISRLNDAEEKMTEDDRRERHEKKMTDRLEEDSDIAKVLEESDSNQLKLNQRDEGNATANGKHHIISTGGNGNTYTLSNGKTIDIKQAIQNGDINMIVAHLIASQGKLMATQVKIEDAIQKIEKQLYKIPDIKEPKADEYNEAEF